MSDTPTPPAPPVPPPAAPPSEGGDDRVAQLNRESAQHRQEAQQLRDQYGWAANLNTTQQQYVQQVADALTTGNGALASRLMAQLNASMGQAAPPQPQQGYAPPPPPQPVWNGYSWELPEQPAPYQQTYPQYAPPPPQQNDLWGAGDEGPQAIDMDTVQDMIRQALEEDRQNQHLVQQAVASINKQMETLDVGANSPIDRSARVLAQNELARLQQMGMPPREVGELYAEQVKMLRDEIGSPSQPTSGLVTAPPPGVTPTPQPSPLATKGDRVNATKEIVARFGGT